ncbi:hypothetical protein Q8F55_005456 [Vanrija albida]|uniref:Transmembrane protein n=1 Tax=Vanrija albida TaxID=181172 RepID=A0ABR3Q1W9_9TREE
MLWYNPEIPWNVSFDGTPWASLQPGMLGLGASRHFAPDGLSGQRNFDIVFPFTAAYVFGRGRAPAAGGSSGPIFKMDETDLASTVKSLDGPVIASEGNRPFRAQILRFGTTSGLVEVDGVTFTTGVQSNATSFEGMPRTEFPFVVNGGPNPAVTTSDNIRIATQLGGVGGQAALQMDIMYLLAGENISVPISPGTTFMSLHGTTGPDHGNFYLRIVPQPPLWWSQEYAILAANSPFVVPNATHFAWPLDPAQSYSVQLAKAAYNTTMGLTSMLFYQGSAGGGALATGGSGGIGKGSPGSGGGSGSGGGGGTADPSPSGGKGKNNAGPIAGGVVGGVLLLALLAGLVLCLRRRRKRAAAPRGAVTPFTPETKNTLDLNDMSNLAPEDRLRIDAYDDTKSGFGELRRPWDDRLSPQVSVRDVHRPGASSSQGSPLTPGGGLAPASTPTTSPNAQEVLVSPSAGTGTPLSPEPEVDAGRVPLDRPPPTYNPDWRDEDEDGRRRSRQPRAGPSRAQAKAAASADAEPGGGKAQGSSRPLPPTPGERFVAMKNALRAPRRGYGEMKEALRRGEGAGPSGHAAMKVELRPPAEAPPTQDAPGASGYEQMKDELRRGDAER